MPVASYGEKHLEDDMTEHCSNENDIGRHCPAAKGMGGHAKVAQDDQGNHSLECEDHVIMAPTDILPEGLAGSLIL